MNKIKGIITGGIYDRTGKRVRDIFLMNYDTIGGRISSTFSDQCYKVDELSVNISSISLLHRIYKDEFVKIPLFPDEPLFVPESFSVRGEGSASSYAISYDNGVNWYIWDGISFDPVIFSNASELLTVGMSLTLLNSISTNDHHSKYVDHIILAIAPNGEDYIDGFDMKMIYKAERSTSSTIRWMSELKSHPRYNFSRTPISVAKNIVGDTTYYDLSISNIGNLLPLVIKNICTEDQTNTKICTFANINLTVDADHVLIGKYRLIRSVMSAVATQIGTNTKTTLLGTSSPTYTDGVFSSNLSNFSGMSLSGSSGFNSPTSNSSIYPVIVDKDLRAQQFNRVVVLPSDKQAEHNKIDAGWSVLSSGHLSITSTDSLNLNGLHHFPIYLRLQMTSTGTETDTNYVPYIQHRPDSLFNGNLTLMSSISGTIFHRDFLRDPKNPLPWNYIEYYDVQLSSEVPKQSVNCFHDVIVEVFDSSVVIRRFNGDRLLKLAAKPGEVFQLAWANRTDPSGHCLYVISFNTVTSLTYLSSIPVSFVFDSSSEKITLSTNGNLNDRYFLSNVSDLDSSFAMVAKDLIDIRTAKAETDSTPSSILTSMTSTDKLYFGYCSNILGGDIGTAPSLLDQKWSSKLLSIAGDATKTTNGSSHVIDFNGAGYGYTNEVTDNLDRRQALKAPAFACLKIESQEIRNATILQMDGVSLRTNAAGEIQLNSDATWPNLMNIESSYGWFIGGNSANSITRLSFADDVGDIIARGNTSYGRTYHGVCFKSMSVWMGGGTESSGTIEKYDLTSDISNSVERGSLAIPMAKGDGQSGDAQYGRFFNRAGNTGVQMVDYDNDTVATTARVVLPIASTATLVDSSMTLYNESTVYWGYPVNNWVATNGTIYHGSTNILQINYNNDMVLYANSLITADTTGGVGGLFGHIFNNNDFGWFSQYSVLDLSECGSGLVFKQLNKNISLITVTTRNNSLGSATACSGTDSSLNRKVSVNNQNFGWSLRGAGDSVQRADLNNDTVGFTFRTSSVIDKRNGAGCSDWLVSNAKPLTANLHIGSYAVDVKSTVGIINYGQMSFGLQGDNIQILPKSPLIDTRPIGWLTVGAKITPNTSYDLISGHTISDHLNGQISDLHVGSTLNLEGIFRHLPYMYNLNDIIEIVSNHTVGSTFTFIIEGHSDKIKHYFINTANSNAITEINIGNMSSVTPVDAITLNGLLSTMKTFFNQRARIGLVTYNMELNGGKRISKTYVKIEKKLKPLHARTNGMDSNGNYAETISATNSRLVNRLFCYNGRGVWIPKGTTQEFSVIEDIVNDKRLSSISSVQTFDHMRVSETSAGFVCFVSRSTATTCSTELLWIGKDDRQWITKTETSGTGFNHNNIGTYNIWDDTWSLQTSLVDSSSAAWDDKSREYYQDTDIRVICMPTNDSVYSGAINNKVNRKGFYQLTFDTDGHMDPTACLPFLYPTKYTLVSSTALFSWNNIRWSFSNGAAAPHFSSGDIFSVALLGYYGMATDNWQIFNNFNLMMHCKSDLTDYSVNKSVHVDISDNIRGRIGVVDTNSSLITEPTAADKFFLY